MTPKIRMEDIALITRSPIFTSRATSKKKKIMKMVTRFKSLEMNPPGRLSNRKIARKARKSSNLYSNHCSKISIRRRATIRLKLLRKSHNLLRWMSAWQQMVVGIRLRKTKRVGVGTLSQSQTRSKMRTMQTMPIPLFRAEGHLANQMEQMRTMGLSFSTSLFNCHKSNLSLRNHPLTCRNVHSPPFS